MCQENFVWKIYYIKILLCMDKIYQKVQYNDQI